MLLRCRGVGSWETGEDRLAGMFAVVEGWGRSMYVDEVGMRICIVAKLGHDLDVVWETSRLQR